MSELSDKQKLMTWCLPLLLNRIHNEGYECTLGDAYRDERSHGGFGEVIKSVLGGRVYGRRWSVHKIRLAIDLNLFKDGVYLTQTEDHKVFGLFWESLDPGCRWGGHYNDGNHYSIIYRGRQ